MSGRNIIIFIFLVIVVVFTYLFLTNGFSSFNLGGVSKVIEDNNIVGISKVGGMSYLLLENFTNYDDRVKGDIVLFDDDVNPSIYPTKKLLNVSIVNGFGTIENTNLIVNHNYSEYFDGGELYYDYSFGSVKVGSNYKKRISGISKVGSVRDLVDEGNRGFFFGNDCSRNKTTKYNVNNCQVYSWKDSNRIAYNVNSLSGGFSFPITIMTTGSNSELKELGLSVKYGKLDKPEGNEYTSITFECVNGCSLINTSKDYVDWWKNQETIKFGNVRDGIFEQYIVNIKTMDIVIGEDTDIWYLVLDDMNDKMSVFGHEKAIPQIETITAIYGAKG